MVNRETGKLNALGHEVSLGEAKASSEIVQLMIRKGANRCICGKSITDH